MKSTSCGFWGRFILYCRVSIILSERCLMSFTRGSHWFFRFVFKIIAGWNKAIRVQMYSFISSLSVFDHGSFDSPLNLILRLRSAYFLYIKHFPDLISGLSNFPNRWLRLLLSENFKSTFFNLLLIFFVLNKRYTSCGSAMMLIHGRRSW